LIAVSDLAPVDLSISGPANPRAGEVVTYTATALDAGGDLLAFTWQVKLNTTVLVTTASGQDITFQVPDRTVIQPPGSYVLSVMVTAEADAETLSKTVTFAINPPPIADAGGPYTTFAATPLALDGSGSVDDEPIAKFEWDLDYDGVTFDVDTVGPLPTVTFATAFAARQIGLRVTDTDGETDIDTTTLAVQTLNQAATTTVLDSSDATPFPGETVTFTATVMGPASEVPTGTVTFTIDGSSPTVVPLDGTGKASFSTSALSVGTHTIAAEFASATNGFTGSSDSLVQTVGQVATTTTLVSSDATSVLGQDVTFTATVTTPEGGVPTGTVTFTIDGGGATMVQLDGSGQATYTTSTLTLGEHSIAAIFNSDTSEFAISSDSLSQTVSSVATTTTLTSSDGMSLPRLMGLGGRLLRLQRWRPASTRSQPLISATRSRSPLAVTRWLKPSVRIRRRPR
jgi:hypothetical protein